ncbi:MAG: NAD-dependent epimerase/dehydratase family protein [Chloroflexi bacterium]|nr:NAD-dependent epimerase/dehydratase family protein [Chloroflexota bacterium]
MKALVTGGAGFIGYHLVKHLLEKDCEVTACDDFFRGRRDDDFATLAEYGNFRFESADLTDATALRRLPNDFDIIYHLAAINGTRYFYEIPAQVLRVNILSTINLLDWMTRTSCRKLIIMSSSETYAGTMSTVGLPVPTPETVPLTVSDVLNPRFSYAGSKIAGELLAVNYGRTHGIQTAVIRPHNIYGPRMGYEHVIPEFLMRIINRENPFRIHGGRQSRAFCHVSDFVQAMESLAHTPCPTDRPLIMNIGNDREEITIPELADKMFDMFNFHPEMKVNPVPEGSVDRRCPDISLARAVLGYEPQVDLETGLRDTYEWYRKHPEKRHE